MLASCIGAARLSIVQLATAWVVLSSCSLLVDEDRQQCSINDDCAAAGAPYRQWTCQASICRPPPDAAVDQGIDLPAGYGCLETISSPIEGTVVDWTVELYDVALNRILTTGDAKICFAHDALCEAPSQQDLHPDSEGKIRFSLPADFVGYLDLRVAGRYPTIMWLSPTFTYDGAPDRREDEIPVFSELIFKSFAQLMSVELDPAAGHVIGRVDRCDGQAAAGVQVEINLVEGEVPIFGYLGSGGLPIDASETDDSGRWGGFNILPGTGEVVGRLSSGPFVGKAALLIRTGHVTVITVSPSPSAQ